MGSGRVLVFGKERMPVKWMSWEETDEDLNVGGNWYLVKGGIR